jgi:hypothetical protein
MANKIAGIDAHKKVLMVVVIDARTPDSKPERRRFTTMPSDLRRLSTWLEQLGVEEAVMESTAQYSRSVWLELEPHMLLHLAQAFYGALICNSWTRSSYYCVTKLHTQSNSLPTNGCSRQPITQERSLGQIWAVDAGPVKRPDGSRRYGHGICKRELRHARINCSARPVR